MSGYKDFASSAIRQLAGASAEHALLNPLIHFSWFSRDDRYLSALEEEHASRGKGRGVLPPVVVVIDDERLSGSVLIPADSAWANSVSPRLYLAKQDTPGVQVVRATSLDDATSFLHEAQMGSVRVARVFIHLKWGTLTRMTEEVRSALFPSLFGAYDASPGTGSTLGIFCRKSDIGAIKACESTVAVTPVLRGTIEPWALRRFSLLLTPSLSQP